MPSRETWTTTWNGLGVAAPDDHLYDELVRGYSAPERHYHTLQHLDECFARLAEGRSLAEHPHEIELALWFHDAIYDVRRQDNEEQSASWAQEVARQAGLSPDVTARIGDLIHATRHDAMPHTADGILLVDIDLAILGAPAERFDEYERQVRQEYAWVPVELFRRKRREILEAFLARPRLFGTAHFRDAYEASPGPISSARSRPCRGRRSRPPPRSTGPCVEAPGVAVRGGASLQWHTALFHILRSASCPGALVGGVVLAWLACAAPLGAQDAQRARTGVATEPRVVSTPRPEEAAATTLLERGKPREALAEIERAVVAYRRAGDRLGLARAALTRSAARRALGDWAQAARDAEEARAFGAGDPALLVQALTHVTRVAVERAEFAHAESALREALAIAERLDDAKVQASVLRMHAVLDDRRGQALDALDHNTRAVRAADRSGDVALRIRTRGSTTATLIGLSRYDAALALAEESHAIATRAGTPALRAAALFDLAQTHAHMWNLDRAAELWTATIDAHRQIGANLMVALAFKQRVETWFALGEFDRAAEDGEKAVALLRDTGQVHYVAETMARVALSHVRRGRMADARVWADRARDELARTPESRHLFVHNDLGLVACELGDLARARADFTRVLDVSRLVGNVEFEWRAHWGFGRAALRDDPTAAVEPLERAIASIERLRQTIPEAGLRAAFMINRVGPYETLVEAHMASTDAPTDDRVRRALEVAERARSRALADLLAEARARTTDPRLAALRDEETAFGRRFSAVQKRVASAGDPAARATALEELHDLEREYETLVVRIRRDNPAYAALAHPRALSAAELSAMLAPDEALIEFLMTDQQGFAFVVRRDATHGYRVPGTKALDPQIRLLTALLTARDDEATQRLGEQLYVSLLAQAEPALRGARRLIIVPDGVLQRLPFALLRANHRWLVETQTLALAPSATVLHFLRQSRTGGTSKAAPEPLLALAVSDVQPGQAAIFESAARSFGTLAHAAQEVDRARQLLGAGPDSVRTGAAATEQVLKSAEAGRYRVLHVAAHAIADEIVPRRSAVLLTPDGQEDGLLQVSEIANLSLNADLVVLAACRSHVGRLVRGEGLFSLSRAFMHAGAQAVVATNWMVADRDTAWLMRQFYTGLRDGLAPDEALQRAQRRALASGGTRATPALWAAFVIVGEARTPIVDAASSRSTAARSTSASLNQPLALIVGALAILGGVVVVAARFGHARRSGG